MNEKIENQISEIDKKLNELEQEELLDGSLNNDEWKEQYKEFETINQSIYLNTEKDKKINEWLDMLSNDNETNWQLKSRTFSSDLFNILEKLLKIQKPHSSWVSQYEIINGIGKYINDNDKNTLKGKILELKELSRPSTNTKKTIKNQEYIVDNTKSIIDNKLASEDLLSNDLDFYLIINKGAILPMEHPNYNFERTTIKILENNNSIVNFDNKKYEINMIILNQIKNYINENVEKLVKYSIMEDSKYLMNNAFFGGNSKEIIIKMGSLIIKLNGQVDSEIGIFCDNFVNKIKEIITSSKLTINIDKMIINAIKQLKSISTGNEFSIDQIMSNFNDIDNFNEKIDIFNKLIEESKKHGIHFEPTINGITGMPWAGNFIKK